MTAAPLGRHQLSKISLLFKIPLQSLPFLSTIMYNLYIACSLDCYPVLTIYHRSSLSPSCYPVSPTFPQFLPCTFSQIHIQKGPSSHDHHLCHPPILSIHSL